MVLVVGVAARATYLHIVPSQYIIGGITAIAGGALAKFYAKTSIGTNAFATSGGATATATNGMAITFSGPISLIVLGASQSISLLDAKNEPMYTFDCWKQILHVNTTKPSKGRLLVKVLKDPRIKHIEINDKAKLNEPMLIVENVWNEKFRIDLLILNDEKLVAHAEMI